MTKHIISMTDFKEPYNIYHELAGSYGKGSNKSLVARVNLSTGLSYEVKDHGVIIFDTGILKKAIEYYNDLP